MNIKVQTTNLSHYKLYVKVEEATCAFLQKKGYLNINLPVLSPALIPESYLEVFETEFNYFSKKEKLFLTPSPELFLKRLLAWGVGDCYYLGKAFRNSEPSSSLHSCEFTMLEFYKTKASYWDIADELLEMFQYIARHIYKTDAIIYQGKKISLKKWEKISVSEAFKTYANIEESALYNSSIFLARAQEKGYKTNDYSYEDVFSQIYTQEIEPHLGIHGYPTLLYDYPKEFAALAQLNPDGKTAQRFEFYIGGIELGDCYTELVDWKEQELRFRNEQEKRNHSQKKTHPIDKGFIEALQYGLIDCAGIAIGFERLAMIFADVESIHKLRLIEIV